MGEGAKTESCKGSRERRVLCRRASDDADGRRFAASLAQLLTFEEFDAVFRMQRHDGLLPAPALARGVAAALGLGLDPGRAHAGDAYSEDVLHGLAHLGLVGALVDAERVLVG